MNRPASALIWLCWRRARLPVMLVMLAIPLVATLVLMSMSPFASLGARENTISIVASVGVWILGPMIASRTQGAVNTTPGVGFPLRSEFSYPVTTLSLTLLPFFFCVGLLLSVFVVSAGLLSLVHDIKYPHLMIHFMVLEYLVIVTALSWCTRNGLELAFGWIVIIALLYLRMVIPEFSLDQETAEFIAGDWSSTIVPTLIAGIALVAMITGVKKQRSGDNLFFSNQQNSNSMKFRTIASVFQLIKSRCPTSSAEAAMYWHQRQFRGLQSSIGLGVAIGLAVVLVLAATSMYGVWGSQLELDDVSGFAIIFFFSVYVAHLAGSFGVTYSNGAARIGTFERTLPLSTARLTFIRIGTGMLSVVVAATAELLTILILGSLLLDNFTQVQAGFISLVGEIYDQGIFYFMVRIILLLCLIYAASVLWAVFITWFAIKPKMMTIGFSILMSYLLLLVTGLAVFTEMRSFLQTADSFRDAHRLVLTAAILLAAIYLLFVLVREQVVTGAQAVGLLIAGLALASLQFADLQLFGALDEDSSIAATIFLHTLGLLPLAATTLALWTQFRVRHG